LKLKGVSWATGSVLLHFAHVEPYPILDIRALWSFGYDNSPHYTFQLWWDYVETCRRMAKQFQVTMRVLDRALWQYSREQNPPPRHTSRN
jgi:hypothetical protein